MTAISAPDATLYRTHPYLPDSFLWVDNPPVVFQALVNQSVFIYPITAAITYDTVTAGSSTNVQIDMLICFGTTAGDDDLGRTRVKGITGTTSGTIGIPRISQGTVDGTVNLADNCHITIYDTYPPAPKIPAFDKPTQTFLKDGDQVFVAALPPIANIGYAHIYADFVSDATNKLTLTIDSSASFSPIGGTLTRLWDVGDGTITSGSTSTTAITVDFPAGRRWIKLTLTDTTNSRATIRRLLIVALKFGTAYVPIVDVQPGTLTQTVEGLRMSFRFGQDIPASTYVDGTAVAYVQREYYNTTQATLNSTTVMKFAGWHHTDPARIAAQSTFLLRETTLDCLDTAGKLATFPGFPQTIESNAAPTRWEEMASPTLDKFLAYLWIYHSTAAVLTDFAYSGTTTTYPFVRLNSLGNSLYGQIDGRARAIGYRLLSDRNGKCKVKKDPLLFKAADRSATNTIALTESDIASISYTHQRPSRSHWNRGNAILANASTVNAVFCIAPGSVPSWGLSANEIGEMLVIDQDELDWRVGNAYQRENADLTYVEVELLHAGDINYEPLDFVQITLSSTWAAQRGLTWTAQRFMIVAVATDPDPSLGTQRRRLTLEFETFGTPAEPDYPPPDPLPDVTPITDLYPAEPPVVLQTNNDFPTQLYALTPDGHFYGGAYNGSRYVWTDISPSGAQRTAIGALGTTSCAVKFEFDHFLANRVTIYATTGFAKCADVTAPSWSTVTGFLPGGVSELCYKYPGLGADLRGDFFASALRPKFYAWTYVVTHSTLRGTGVQGTYDDFATFFNNNLDTTDFTSGLQVSGLAQSSVDASVWCGTGHTLYKSTNWAASFAALTYPYNSTVPTGNKVWNAPVNMPAALPGGSSNSANDNLLSILRNSANGKAYLATGVNTFEINNSEIFRSSNALHSYTQNGQFLASISLNGNFRTSDDGGASWVLKTLFPTHPGADSWGLNGWPTNPQYLLVFGAGTLAYTLDFGDTWIDLEPDLNADTGATGAIYAAGYAA